MRPTIRISLKGGRAAQNRAPVEDLIVLLHELQALTVDIGKQLSGGDVPEEVITKSCALDIVGLSYGSLTPVLELAYFTESDPNPIGRRAVEEVCRAFSVLRDPDAYPVTHLTSTAVEHIDRMARLLDRGYEAIESTCEYDDVRVTGTIDAELRAALIADQVGGVTVDGVTVRGILYGLQDRPREREKEFFKGELSDEAGQAWAVRFPRESVDLARQFWRTRVELTGQARYTRVRRPVLFVSGGKAVHPEDWQTVLRQQRGAWRELFAGEPFDRIVDDLR